MGKLNINILGKSFSVQAKADDEYLAKLHSYYKEVVKIIQTGYEISDPLKISILAGINLVDELYKQKQKTAAFKESVTEESENELKAERITAQLIDRITQVLDE